MLSEVRGDTMWRQIVLSFLLAWSVAAAELVTLDKPIYAEVYLKGTTPRPVKVSGNLTSYDESLFTLHVGNDDKQLNWDAITPSSAFTLRQRVTDKSAATELIKLGKFGIKIGARDQAMIVLKSAARLDPSTKSNVDAIINAALEISPPTTAPSIKEPVSPAQPDGKKTEKTERIKYQPATPEQIAEAMKNARDDAKEVGEKLRLDFDEVETDHFIIFTDWDKREYNFLKTNLEAAYVCVSKQFEMSPKDNVFVGKLPVYMFATYKDFAKFASEMDRFPVTNRVAGYYTGNDSGSGHMAMWKPNQTLTGTSNIRDAERLWAYVLTHEFTHAFLARYRSNVFIPRWLNEGIAEVVASSQFPDPSRRQMAQSIAYKGTDVGFLFDSSNMPTGEYYPVMQTMVEMLVSSNRKKFLGMIDAIKDGTEPESALQQFYNTDYGGIATTWREWIKRQSY